MSTYIPEEFVRIYFYGEGDEVEFVGSEFGFAIEGKLAHALFAQAGLTSVTKYFNSAFLVY